MGLLRLLLFLQTYGDENNHLSSILRHYIGDAARVSISAAIIQQGGNFTSHLQTHFLTDIANSYLNARLELLKKGNIRLVY
jgi:hypothetical protein